MSAMVTAAMLALVSAVELTAKPATLRGVVEGQSPEKGKAKSSGLDPSPEGPSRPENSVRTPGTGSLGKVAGLLGPLAELSGPVETSSLAMGLVEGRPGPSADSGRISEQELAKYFGMLNHEFKNNRGFRNFSLKATKKGKPLISFNFRLPIEVRMSGESPPGFTLVTSKKRSSKAAKLATGTTEGQSLGKAKLLGPEPEGPSSRLETLGRLKIGVRMSGDPPPPVSPWSPRGKGLRRWRNRQ